MAKNRNRIVMGLSGGMDSGVLLGWLVHTYGKDSEFHCVVFDYGSKHSMYEQQAATRLMQFAKDSGVNIAGHLMTVLIPKVFGGTESALLGRSTEKIPEGHYEAETMKQTVVPGRNSIFLATLLSFAEANKCDTIALGVHQGDHHIYPDCRPEWVHAASKLAEASSEGKVRVLCPFMTMAKADIVKIGLEQNFPFGLSRTCYKDQNVACGKCGSCTERLEAFLKNGVVDFIKYEGGCSRCGEMHAVGDSSAPAMVHESPAKKDKSNVSKLPRAHQIVERFARVMSNAAANGKHVKTESGNHLLNAIDVIARADFNYDLFKDQPVS